MFPSEQEVQETVYYVDQNFRRLYMNVSAYMRQLLVFVYELSYLYAANFWCSYNERSYLYTANFGVCI
jgi:hypothetical protein